jgi:hypothetical protein
MSLSDTPTLAATSANDTSPLIGKDEVRLKWWIEWRVIYIIIH